MASDPTPAASPEHASATDVLFKRIITIFTALSMAAAYGWLAGFERQADGNMVFHWHWPVLPWGIIGFVTTAYLWRQVWPSHNRPTATRGDIIKGIIVFLVPCLWWITFPLRFLSGQHFWDVMEGLIAAGMVLTFGAWMVIRLIKAFEGSDREDIEAENRAASAATQEGLKK